MKLIIGLGNPGTKYLNTRHNFGFMALDYFQKENGFLTWKNAEKFKVEISQGEISDEKIILAKPQTFMNLSGQAVRVLADFYKIALEDILIVHDDIDLPLGAMRLSQNSGPAGHKGIKSIIECLATQNFSRLRLGIKPKESSFSSLFKSRLFASPLFKRRLGGILKTPAEKFVLQNFSPAEKLTTEEIIKKAAETIHLFIKEKNTSKA